MSRIAHILREVPAIFRLQGVLQKPTLHRRIARIFLASFIIFIFIAGGSLVLSFNYQMYRYTEFVSDHYAKQLARVLEFYYKNQQSWLGINEWLYQNFTSSEQALDFRVPREKSMIRFPFYLSATSSSTKPGLSPGNQDEILDPVLDLWFYEFHIPILAPLFHYMPRFSATRPKSYQERTLQDFLSRQRLSDWTNAEDRPELFSMEWTEYPAGLPLFNKIFNHNLVPGYINTPPHNNQIFILLDSNSQQVIASNLNPNDLKKTMGQISGSLKTYIRYYLANRSPQPSQTKRVRKIWQLGNPSEQLPPNFNASLYFPPEPSLEEKRNIFVIHDRSSQAIAFLYAKSIVSPVWADLNSEVNRTIINIALFSCLIVLLIYWLVGSIHLRRLFQPLKALSDVAAQVRKGNSQARVKTIPREIELALVTEQFNKMLDSINYQNMLREQQSRDIAHELRTPITIISGELQLIQEGVYQPDQESIEGLITQTQQMQRIVQDLETLYKATQENGKQMMYFESISAVQLLDEAFWAFWRHMEQQQIAFSLYPGSRQAAEPKSIYGDPRRLHQVFANCLVNAMHHTPAGGAIELGCSYLGPRKPKSPEDPVDGLDRTKEYLVFSVSDSGCGIPIEKRELVFERFFRMDVGRSSQSGGSGLGLAISKSFIELHSGKIWATSSHLGEGARFCFALPCYSLPEPT